MPSKSERLARLEEKHKALRERHGAQVKSLEERITTRDAQNESHFIALNGEQARIAKIQGDMQSKDGARADVDKVFAKIDANDKATDLRLSALEGAGNVNKGRAVIPNLLWGAIVGGLGSWLVLRLLQSGR